MAHEAIVLSSLSLHQFSTSGIGQSCCPSPCTSFPSSTCTVGRHPRIHLRTHYKPKPTIVNSKPLPLFFSSNSKKKKSISATLITHSISPSDWCFVFLLERDCRETMASQEYMDKMELRQSYRNVWHSDLMNTIQEEPPCKL